MRLQNKVAIVTGSTSGVGKATAHLFAREGANVLVTGRNREEGESLEAELRRDAAKREVGDVLFVPADLAVTGAMHSIVDAAVARWGKVDILVNNAAMMTFGPVCEMEEEDWDRLMDVNLRAPFVLARRCLPHMADGSAIVNVSSVHAEETMSGLVPYATSKGGLEAFTRGLAVELRPRHIRVNAVRLGAVDTPLLWNNPNVRSGVEKIDPADVGTPEQAAQSILFLASGEAAYTTGAILNVDGGRLAVL